MKILSLLSSSRGKIILALLIVAMMFVLSVFFLFFDLNFADIVHNQTPHAQIFWNYRLPRFILAFLVGASLSVTGVAFQALLKNPLADPYILGVSGGAAFGYIFAVVIGVSLVALPFVAFFFALMSLVLIYFLSQNYGVISTTTLLLIGVMFNSFAFAAILVVNVLFPFQQAFQILNLLLGSVEVVAWSQILVFFILFLVGFIVLMQRSLALNILALGHEEALHLGVKVEFEKRLLFVTTSLLVGASVSLCGLIGFVGLFVPHLVRLIVGADHRMVFPFSAMVGGVFLLFCDFVSRFLLFGSDHYTKLPLGAVTALIGVPIFVYLLKKQAVVDV